MSKTDKELNELAKCVNDIVYFVENYIVVMTNDGAQRVTLRDYQKEIIKKKYKNIL
jgi:hypothetical protein